MQTPTPGYEIVVLSLQELKTHPLQRTICCEHDSDVESLAADIDVRGLQRHIEVLPDMTIVSGHRRAEAFRRLGRTTIPAVVRRDLTI